MSAPVVSLFLGSLALSAVFVNGTSRAFLSMEDAKDTLLSELTATLRAGGQTRIAHLEQSLQTIFSALPKNTQGNLEHNVARFALHRYFSQSHGWFITGLEPVESMFNNTAAKGSLKDWIPSYLFESFEKLLGMHGANLRELAVLAATLEDLIYKEESGRLAEIYTMYQLPPDGTLNPDQVQDVVKTYLSIYTTAGNSKAKSIENIKEKGVRLHSKDKEWLLKDVKMGTMLQGEYNFTATMEFVDDIGKRYGNFNDHECQEVKSTLLRAGDRTTGRVRLADFYKEGKYGYWNFNEKIEYLRALGTLDESIAEDPTVIITNYVSARHNCLAASSLYAVCCLNDCEGLMGHLERSIATPLAEPTKVLELVENLPSRSVEAPRKLSSGLASQLDEVARINGGKVPLFGRMFAQWMHHVFPRECPYPHADAINPQTPDEWLKTVEHNSTEASSAEILRTMDKETKHEKELPWTQEEKYLVPPAASQVSTEDMKRMLSEQLQSTFRAGASKDRLTALEEQLRPMFTALPKNTDGTLDHTVARFALHRTLMQQHGWFITGLEPLGVDGSNASLSDWVPSHLMDIIEKLLGTHSINLEELAVLAATFEDLVHKEAHGRLEDIFEMLDIPRTGALTKPQAFNVIINYMSLFTGAGNVTARSVKDIKAKGAKIHNITRDWLADLAREHGFEGAMDFNSTERFVEKIGEEYGEFNNVQCKEVKQTLLGMGDYKTARVRLPDFYNKQSSRYLKFKEDIGYLRMLGALDESVPNRPLVIIPNYVSARSNCLVASNFYAVCCKNECEDLMGHLESKIQASTADPDRIAEIVSALPSDTVEAPRELPETLLQQLYKVGQRNGGQVPLHGRLFAQWMHHAYPRECPFPHEAAANPQTPDEWMQEPKAEGGADAVRRKGLQLPQAVPASADEGQKEIKLPWSEMEKLLGHSNLSASQVSVEALKEDLVSELTGTLRSNKDDLSKGEKDRLAALEGAMYSMYASLPKNAHGTLEHDVARFALHRFFATTKGWFITGLEPAGDAFINGSSPFKSLKDRVASDLVENIEKLLGTQHIALRELAVLAATFEDLINKEEMGRLEDIYNLRGYEVNGTLKAQEVQTVLTIYLSIYTSAGNNVTKTSAEIKKKGVRMHPKTLAWLNGVKKNFSFGETSDFAKTTRIVEEIGNQYGDFNDHECKEVKSELLKIGDWKTGRVSLTDFYTKGSLGYWSFNEKVEYLRSLGVLDETDPEHTSVIVTNYMSSRHNCLMASNFYAVCCRNSCEDMMGYLEREISAPAADADRIAQLVMDLPSETVAAPRTISAALLHRLHQVAASNGGHVPLHGRLFAQWMHHAYPRECPYPHQSASNPQTADEWMKESGHTSSEASEDDISFLLKSEGEAPEADQKLKIAWVPRETLIATHRATEGNDHVVRNTFLIMIVALVVVTMFLLLRSEVYVERDVAPRGRLDEDDSGKSLTQLKEMSTVRRRLESWRATTNDAMLSMTASVV